MIKCSDQKQLGEELIGPPSGHGLSLKASGQELKTGTWGPELIQSSETHCFLFKGLVSLLFNLRACGGNGEGVVQPTVGWVLLQQALIKNKQTKALQTCIQANLVVCVQLITSEPVLPWLVLTAGFWAQGTRKYLPLPGFCQRSQVSAVQPRASTAPLWKPRWTRKVRGHSGLVLSEELANCNSMDNNF